MPLILFFFLLLLEWTGIKLNVGSVIHVMVVAKEEERLTLESLLLDSVASRRRELVFRCGMGRLLAGELTSQAIDGLARQLLSNLLFFLKHDEQVWLQSPA